MINYFFDLYMIFNYVNINFKSENNLYFSFLYLLYVNIITDSSRPYSGNHRGVKPYLVDAKLGRCSRCPNTHPFCHEHLCVKSCSGLTGCGQ